MNLSGVRLYVKSSVELTVDLTVNLTTDTRLNYAENVHGIYSLSK